MQNVVVDATGFVVIEENYILNVHFDHSVGPYMQFYCLFKASAVVRYLSF